MIRRLETVPAALARIDQAPKSLFFDGNLELLKRPCVAVVGTRRPCGYTKGWVQRISAALAGAGATVVSGGAIGVDALAHEAAGSATVAVLAGSIDVGFVQTNKRLIAHIRQNGLVLSEYESATPPKPWGFVHRNRLVTGLAQAVIVAEADEKSGSMTSAQFALKQKRPLYVLPHRLGESGGTQSLLQRGLAKPLWSVETLLADLGLATPVQEDDFMRYCQNRPTYEEALERFGAAVYEHELSGRILVRDGRIEVDHAAAGH
ncbi:MAG: DNA-processing protein DprA [Campylobacterales bacterium]